MIGLAAFWVGRLLFASNAYAALAAILVFFAGVPASHLCFTYLHAHYLCVLGAAGVFVQYLRDRQTRHLLLCGLAVGAGLFFSFYFSGAAAAAIVLILLLDARGSGKTWHETVAVLLKFLAGPIGMIALVGLLFADIWWPMARAVVVDSVAHGTARTHIYGYAIHETLLTLLSAFKEAAGRGCAPLLDPNCLDVYSRLVEAGAYHVLPFVAVGLWLRRSRRGQQAGDAPPRLALAFIVWWGCFGFVRGFSRGSIYHLSQALTPLFFLVVFLLRDALKQRDAMPGLRSKLATAVLIATVFGLGQRALVSSVIMPSPCHVVRGPFGVFRVPDHDTAEEANGLIAEVLNNTRESDFIFVIPQNAPPLHALTRRPNPSYYDSLADLARRPSPDKENQVCRDILDKGTKLVIRNRGAGERSKEKYLLLMKCVDEHFEVCREFAHFSVLRRKER
jgi:hypothetical protein